MIDVFFCTMVQKDMLRHYMSRLCYQRWLQEPGARLYFRQGTEPAFQRQRRIDADQDAESEIYILTDDDCFPPAEPFVEEAVRIMEDHPEFAILSMMPSNAHIARWRPPGEERGEPTIHEITIDGKGTGTMIQKYPVPHEDDDVMEHVSVGGIRFCRKDCLEEWPPFTGPGYDKEQAEAIREKGMRVGYFRNLKMLHLGEGHSSVWP